MSDMDAGDLLTRFCYKSIFLLDVGELYFICLTVYHKLLYHLHSVSDVITLKFHKVMQKQI